MPRLDRTYHRKNLTAEETIEEVEHLLWMQQGTGYIVRAVHAPSYAALARRLMRQGRHDLANVFNAANTQPERGAYVP